MDENQRPGKNPQPRSLRWRVFPQGDEYPHEDRENQNGRQLVEERGHNSPLESGEFSNFIGEFAIHLWYYSVTLSTKLENVSGLADRADFQFHLRAFRQVNFMRG